MYYRWLPVVQLHVINEGRTYYETNFVYLGRKFERYKGTTEVRPLFKTDIILYYILQRIKR